MNDSQTMRNSAISPSEGNLQLPPNAEQLINALRQIGYSFEQAISDLVDNCLNAKASNVLIRIDHDDKAIGRLLIVDDGHGMTGRVLDKAMRFGAHEDLGDLSLGKFGMGMKLASFSHAKTLSVNTISGGTCSGRRWTVEGISRDWTCEAIPEDEVRALLGAPYASLDLARCGTVIEWSRIDRLSSGKNGVDATVSHLIQRLKVHLGLHFHRFLETGRLTIRLDSKRAHEDVPDRAVDVAALNPFKYEESGSSEFPQTFTVDIPEIGKVNAIAHIWPPNSKSQEYKLGNRAAARQGFYFYRHGRLIQPGGWNGVVEHETEPHTSLARVAIDLPDSMDEHFGLNVQKSLVIVPPPFVELVQKATSSGGMQFSKYRALAERVYRRKDNRAQSDYPLVPDGSLPADVARKAKEVLAEGERTRSVEIVWDDLSEFGALFEVDKEKMCLRLDKRMRKQLLGGRRASAADLPVVKLLFFLLLEEDFDKARQSAPRRKRLDAITELLNAALKFEG
ncbi:ATP-binding protein [Rhodanobacter aciditrophus]|uniref:ATP-binding protein n=1 Tax=Rhodanobacter aciditrophus TaxID=1623218 RepID=UPI003CE85942